MKGQVPAGIQQVGAIGTRPHWCGLSFLRDRERGFVV